ncbi:MAG: LD-carboxypeptidase [Bdellovibrionales bacterium]|nr:LD-carboxypeptidase [Bdellovibrionales bacterium]
MIKIGIVATSSVIPKVEFEMGVEHLRRAGFQVEIHPIALNEYYFYPAGDEERARALIEFSMRPDLDVIWCGRGGYGATHLLPFLNHWKRSLKGRRLKKKTMIGFSDITALLEWYRVNFKWETIHAPMPSLRTFSVLKRSEWDNLMNLLKASLKKEKPKQEPFGLEPIFVPKDFKAVTAPLVGGNLAVWNALLGTPDQGSARGKILFLEEIQENLGRINRMMHHLEQAGGLNGCKGIVLGDFTECNDSVPAGLKMAPPEAPGRAAYLHTPPKEAMGFLRSSYTTIEGLDFIFRSVGERHRIPVFSGLPVGHGSSHHSLYLGKRHTLDRKGNFFINP